MVSNESPQQDAPVAQLAHLLMQQRGESPRHRPLTAYSAALRQRMQQLRAEKTPETVTGADLFRTIPRQDQAAWEEISQEEQALYNAVVYTA